MQALIHVGITESTGFQYTYPIIDFVKSNYIDVVTLDVDNHSDSFLIEYAFDLVRESDKSVIVLNPQPTAKLNNIRLFIEFLIDNKKKIFIIKKGNNLILNKMLQIFSKDQICTPKNEIEEQEAIRGYFG